jgi:hypothetical protein
MIKLKDTEPEQLRQDVIAAVNTAMNQGWVLLLLRSIIKVYYLDLVKVCGCFEQ